MKLTAITIALAGSALLALSAPANAGPTILVTPTLAPNAFGSPSYASWVANSIEAQRTNSATQGTPGTPTYYQAQANVTAAEAIVTGFPSWKGQANPGVVFGAAFASELGNRMLFGVKINGNGEQFSISNLSFDAVSSDPDNALGFSFALGSYNYSNDYVGLLKGTDGILFTADDVLITGGANTQLVDGLIGRGSGSSFAAYCDPCTVAQQQAAIDAAAALLTGNTTFTGIYTLAAPSAEVIGSGAFNITAPVPEPASWAMMIGGFALIGAAMRRKALDVRFA